MKRILTVTHSDGTTERVQVACGSDKGARRLPARIGRALISGTACAHLDYDGCKRVATVVSRRYYMRKAR